MHVIFCNKSSVIIKYSINTTKYTIKTLKHDKVNELMVIYPLEQLFYRVKIYNYIHQQLQVADLIKYALQIMHVQCR